MVRIHAVQAHTHIALADVERHRLARGLGQGAHVRQHHVAQTHAALVKRAEHQRRGADLVAAVFQAKQHAVLDERTGQPQNRALVKPGARSQLGQRQRVIAGAERKQDRERAVQRSHARLPRRGGIALVGGGRDLVLGGLALCGHGGLGETVHLTVFRAWSTKRLVYVLLSSILALRIFSS
ncbi:hypothetical protein DL771_011507 [Monosporascus sp. 5C6A]|nr:hypothetical protein DL771_011507 [Monosporascus sp. 5C6A]